MKPALIIAAVAIGLFRPVLLFREFNAHVEAGYEAFAHILVGVLLALWLANGHSWAKWTFWVLTAVEVACAVAAVVMKQGTV